MANGNKHLGYRSDFFILGSYLDEKKVSSHPARRVNICTSKSWDTKNEDIYIYTVYIYIYNIYIYLHNLERGLTRYEVNLCNLSEVN